MNIMSIISSHHDHICTDFQSFIYIITGNIIMHSLINMRRCSFSIIWIMQSVLGLVIIIAVTAYAQSLITHFSRSLHCLLFISVHVSLITSIFTLSDAYANYTFHSHTQVMSFNMYIDYTFQRNSYNFTFFHAYIHI